MAESAPKVAPDLTILPTSSHTELKSQWTETFGTAPPKGLSRRLLIRALAYANQTRDQGRLKPATRKRLFQIGTTDSSTPTEKVSPLTPGTRLMREWRGTVHVVDVTEEGLVWNGRVYASLSAIARTITGTRWSGMRFFGLRKRSDAVDASKTTRSTAPSSDACQAPTLQTDGALCPNEENTDTDTDTSLMSVTEFAKPGLPLPARPETVS